MTRLHTDPVEVRSERDAPAQFLWRGRLYLVREVLARWTESGQWWRTDAVRALTSGDSGAPGAGALLPGSPSGSLSVDDGECDWWRVEAGTGRHEALTAGTGVYDLCFDGARGSWSLARVLD